MTVRSPLKYDDANTLQEMSSDEVTAWVNHICYLYGGNPSVTLTVDTGSAQNLQAMSDTRLKAGAASTNSSAFVAEGTTAEPATVTVNYDKITGPTFDTSLSVTSDTNNVAFPAYKDGDDIKAMTAADFKETFNSLPPEDISFPRGMNGLKEYSDQVTLYKKGTPIHVKGAILYNAKLKN